MNELTEIFNKFGTDRGENPNHGWGGVPLKYTDVYHSYFNKIRHENINLLEIGIHDARFPGASLAGWTEYFTNVNFYGYDIIDCKKFEKPRTKTFHGNQNDSEDLSKFVDQNPVRFDIIIDDGSHILEHIVKSFTHLFPRLKKGGYYFIEDLMVINLGELLEFLDKNKKNLEISNYTLFNNNWLILIER